MSNRILEFIADVANDANLTPEKAIKIVRSVIAKFKSGVFDDPDDIVTLGQRMRERLATNDDDADQALADKFDGTDA